MTRRQSRTAQAPVDEEVLSAGVAFGTPPSTRNQKYDWASIAERCKAQPGEWYLVFEQGLRSTAVAVRTQSVAAMSEAAGFESMTRNNKAKAEPPLCDLWVRYVPAKAKSKRSN